YGRITIEADTEGLRWLYRGLAGTLSHRHFEVFETPEDPMSFEPDSLPITFLYDRDGYINRVSVPFEPQVAEILFLRLADGEATDPIFRAACVGVYLRGTTRFAVALDSGGQLTLSPTGQPTYRLRPYRERRFIIEEMEGYRIEFRRGTEGGVESIIFHQ